MLNPMGIGFGAVESLYFPVHNVGSSQSDIPGACASLIIPDLDMGRGAGGL